MRAPVEQAGAAEQPTPQSSTRRPDDDAQEISELLLSTSLKHRPKIEFLRKVDDTVHELRSVDGADLLVLFTPVIPPPSHINTKDKEEVKKHEIQEEAMDPFEPLGRALCDFHKRVRHVPFLSGAGMKEIHRTFLENAGAVLLVLCEPFESETNTTVTATPPPLESAPTISKRKNGNATKSSRAYLGEQSSFAQELSGLIDELEYSVPVLLLIVATDRACADNLLQNKRLDGFDTVLFSDGYSPTALKELVEQVFKP
jgi:hypothetical protein